VTGPVRDLALAGAVTAGSLTVAPILVARQDSLTWSTGFGLVEDIEGLVQGIRSGSWIGSAFGGFAVSMDALGMLVDPLGNLAAWGVSWLLEHVQPLRQALDAVGGDPDQIRAHAETCRNAAAALATAIDPITTTPAGWTGAAATAYQGRAHTNGLALRALATATTGVSTIVEVAGMLVATVRSLVRDLIAQFVATLAVRLPQWAAELGLTLGIATPAIALQVTALVARYATRIKKVLHTLITKARQLSGASDQIAQHVNELDLTPTHAGTTLHDPLSIPDMKTVFTEGTVKKTFSFDGISKAEQEMLNRTITRPPKEIAPASKKATCEVDFTDGTQGVFKPINGERSNRPHIPAGEQAYREVAASRLDEELGFGLVPTTTLREAGPPTEGLGSVQRFVPGLDARDVTKYQVVEQERMAVLDYVIANTDRHKGNWRTAFQDKPRTAFQDKLFTDRGLVAIDHGDAFPTGATDPIKSDFVRSIWATTSHPRW
jgi:hypothetical protein